MFSKTFLVFTTLVVLIGCGRSEDTTVEYQLSQEEIAKRNEQRARLCLQGRIATDAKLEELGVRGLNSLRAEQVYQVDRIDKITDRDAAGKQTEISKTTRVITFKITKTNDQEGIEASGKESNGTSTAEYQIKATRDAENRIRRSLLINLCSLEKDFSVSGDVLGFNYSVTRKPKEGEEIIYTHKGNIDTSRNEPVLFALLRSLEMTTEVRIKDQPTRITSTSYRLRSATTPSGGLGTPSQVRSVAVPAQLADFVGELFSFPN